MATCERLTTNVTQDQAENAYQLALDYLFAGKIAKARATADAFFAA